MSPTNLNLKSGDPQGPAGKLLSMPRAARYLGVGRTRMWSLIVAKRIPCRSLDGRTVVLTSDLDAFVDGLPPGEPDSAGMAKVRQGVAR
jgi:hypothetical protein